MTYETNHSLALALKMLNALAFEKKMKDRRFLLYDRSGNSELVPQKLSQVSEIFCIIKIQILFLFKLLSAFFEENFPCRLTEM